MNTFDYIKDDAEIKIEISGQVKTISKSEFVDIMNSNDICISSAGVLYKNDTRGLLAGVLDKWYDERKEFKKKMIKASESGDEKAEQFYDKRQHVQKILLNSLYGVLGLDIFRFYDLDNALSVTSTGKDIIKGSAKQINNFYTNLLIQNGAPESTKGNDYVIYVDTDSNYMSNKPLIDLLKIEEDEKCKKLTIKTAEKTVDAVNEFYDNLMYKSFNCKNHVIKTAGETVGRSSIWIAKKRYCIHKIYDLEKKKDVDKFHVKGLDVIRSSFPVKFKSFMLDEKTKKGIISDFLLFEPKIDVDEKILTFRKEVGNYPVEQVARNTSVKNVSKFEKEVKKEPLGYFPKVVKDGKTLTFPAHIKAAINFNKFLKHHGLEKEIEPIFNGEKIKYVYLKKNEFGLEEIAFRGYRDPKVIMDFIEKYADGRGLYEKELQKKINDFYDALGWNYPSEGDKVLNEFFSGNNVEGPAIRHEKKKREKIVAKVSDKADSFFSF